MTDSVAPSSTAASTGEAVTACALIIGNEILSGRTADVNLNHIARTLGRWGIQLREARVIPDVAEEIIAAVNAARARFDYVFTTGGIGPTHDDITAECIAEAFGLPLVQHPGITERIARLPAPPDVMAARLRMARTPEGAELVDNPTGGPQGFRIKNVIVMAGIPGVMQAMLSTLAGKLASGPMIQSRSVVAYLGESQIAGALQGVQTRFPDVELGSYPFFRDGRYGTSLVMRATDARRLDAMCAAVCEVVREAGEEPHLPDAETDAVAP